MKNIFRRKGGNANRARAKEDIPQTATTPTAVGSEETETPKVNEYSKYGITSPPKVKGKKARSLKMTEKAIRQDGFGEFLKGDLKKSDKTTALVYLYGRGFFSSDEDERILKVKKLLRSKSALKLLLKLVTNDGDRDDTATKRQLFINTKVALDRYFEQKGAFSFLCGHQSGKKPEFYCRTQKQGSCFIHGPCITDSYLLQRHDLNVSPDGLDRGVVDVVKYIRRTFSDQELYEYLFHDNGGESVSTFQTIVEDSIGKIPKFYNGCPEALLGDSGGLRELLSKYGPGLVSGFAVSGHFLCGGDQNSRNQIGFIQFTGKDNEKAKGVFVRLDGDKSDENAVKVELEDYLRRLSVPSVKLFGSTSSDTGCEEKKMDESSEAGLGNFGKFGEAAASTGKDAAKTKKEEGNHAMALIGGRHDESENKDYFLLQNWWSDMQLVEIDLDYLVASGANLHFVKPENFDDVRSLDLEECYSMNRYKVADAYNLDRADTLHGCFNRLPRDRML